MNPRFRSVIFDFDYTLADSAGGILECLNFAFNEMNLPAVDADTACRTIGLSLPDTFHRLTGESDRSRTRRFTHLFIQKANEVMVDQTVLFNSVPGAIGRLRQQGRNLGIVSTKYRHRIESVLEREGLLESFDVIVGGEDVAAHKPSPEGLLVAVERLKSAAPNCLYVGDSLVDAETAHRAGVPFAAVLTGVTEADAFKAYPTEGVLGDLSELPRWME
ncbi:MAG: HAD-IA family hydrolase [Acidobacteria bacterium]|nr:HAD-IA family hydrolase [Acidobacteriota bacterium]